MRKFVLETGLTLTQVLQLRGLTGAMSSLTNVFEEATVILRKEGIFDKVCLTSHIRNDFFNNSSYQQECDELVKESSKTTVTIGGKKYYEDELAAALASIKEVKS
jgi:hypothetical protein